MPSVKKIEQKGHISVSFIGEGIVYETLILLSLWDLPALIVVENNNISQSTSSKQNMAGSICDRVKAFDIHYVKTDTYDLDALIETAQQCISFVREQCRPAVLEVRTDRLMSHSKGDDNRDEATVRALWERDVLSKLLEEPNWSAVYHDLEVTVEGIIEEVSELEPFHRKSMITDTRERSVVSLVRSDIGHRRVNDAIYTALKTVMEDDSRIVIIGEDIENSNEYNPGSYGGAFKVTKDLSNLYPGRVRNTPISEAAIVGVGNGMALAGLRPVVEIMFGDFLPLAFDQILNHGAKFTQMFGRDIEIPVLIRVPMGGRRGYGPTHSQSLEKHFMGISGLDIYALNHRIDNEIFVTRLINTIRIPTLLIENKVLYTSYNDKEFLVGYSYDVTECGDLLITPDGVDPDALVICYGQMLEEVEEAVASLSYEDEIYCAVACYANISEPDITLLDSFEKLPKLMILVEEGSDIAGFGAEVIARCVTSDRYATAVFRRIGNRELIPCAKEGEQWVIPNSKLIAEEVRSNYGRL